MRRQSPQHNDQAQQPSQSAELSSVVGEKILSQGYSPKAHCKILSCVASSAENYPCNPPPRMTRMRSLIPNTSSISDEIMIMATPDAVSRFIN